MSLATTAVSTAACVRVPTAPPDGLGSTADDAACVMYVWRVLLFAGLGNRARAGGVVVVCCVFLIPLLAPSAASVSSW